MILLQVVKGHEQHNWCIYLSPLLSQCGLRVFLEAKLCMKRLPTFLIGVFLLASPFSCLLSPFSFLLSPFSVLLSPFSFLLSPFPYFPIIDTDLLLGMKVKYSNYWKHQSSLRTQPCTAVDVFWTTLSAWHMTGVSDSCETSQCISRMVLLGFRLGFNSCINSTKYLVQADRPQSA